MNDGYNELKELYRAAQVHERPSRADRFAVHKAVIGAATTAVQVMSTSASAATAGVHATKTGAIVAKSVIAKVTGSVLGTSGAAQTTANISLFAAKNVIHGLVASKFLTGLLIGAAIGTGVSVGAPFVLGVSREAPATVTRFTAPKTVVRAQPPKQHSSHVTAPVVTEPVVMTQPKLSQISPANSLPRADAVTKYSVPLPVAMRSNDQDYLTQETEALAKVQVALTSKAPMLAIALLEEQQRAFPAGLLSEERDAARVLALCAAGRIDEAEQARKQFLELHANSPLLKRVQGNCEK